MTAVWDLKGQLATDKGKDVFDCLIAEFLLSEGRYAPTQDEAFKKYAIDSLEELMKKQQEKLAEFPALENLFSHIEMPLVSILYHMEQTGIELDTDRLKKLGGEIMKAIILREDHLKKEIGFDINLNSSLQMGNYLVEKEGVPLGKTKTGKYATNESELAKFADQFPIIKHLLTYRELKKLHSTYVESLIEKVDGGNRLHTTYHQVAVSTGRLASSNPNLQNIPVTSDFGKQIKSCFVASSEHTLLSFDYSQQELRILAHLSGEEKLISAFQENRDVHKTTASQLFSVAYEEVTKEQRQIGKTINFGIIYGMSSYGLSESMHIPVEDADLFIKTFYETYPKIREYYKKYLADGLMHDVVETILGRRRFVRAFPNQKFIDNTSRRVLMNYPIQGSAADLMKLVMVKVSTEILDKNPKVKLLLQIHDDLVFEVPDDQKFKDTIVPQIRDVMCGVYPLKVPVEIDVKTGYRWGELELYHNAK